MYILLQYMSKKIPTNKKYENVRAKTDTGKFEMFLCLHTHSKILKSHMKCGVDINIDLR